MKSVLPPVLSRSVVILAVGALLGATAFAQAPATPAPGAAPATPAEKLKPLASSDSTYLKNALKSLAYQIQLADAGKALTDLNQARLRDETARDLAAARDALNKIATAHGEKVVTDVTGTDKIDLDRVTKSKQLAKDWAAALAKESKRLDEKTKETEKMTQDAELKTFITNYGPSIRNVFTSSDALDKQLKKSKY